MVRKRWRTDREGTVEWARARMAEQVGLLRWVCCQVRMEGNAVWRLDDNCRCHCHCLPLQEKQERQRRQQEQEWRARQRQRQQAAEAAALKAAAGRQASASAVEPAAAAEGGAAGGGDQRHVAPHALLRARRCAALATPACLAVDLCPC
jgi:hypothetical protein